MTPMSEEDLSLAKLAREAAPELDRTCEFCGCHTNAHIRRCCDEGARADRITALTPKGPSHG